MRLKEAREAVLELEVARVAQEVMREDLSRAVSVREELDDAQVRRQRVERRRKGWRQCF